MAALVELERNDRLPRLQHFWSHRGDGPGPWMLSQWYPSPFTVDGVRYATAEHWMMAAKARLFGDDRALEQVLDSDDPVLAKAAGRAVQGFDSARWSDAADGVVVAGSVAKFTSAADLLWYLWSTAPAVLVEASPEDTVWGIGLTARHPDAWRPSRWRGSNRLGFALMAAREHLIRTAPEFEIAGEYEELDLVDDPRGCVVEVQDLESLDWGTGEPEEGWSPPFPKN